jgi:hypothetical protein
MRPPCSLSIFVPPPLLISVRKFRYITLVSMCMCPTSFLRFLCSPCRNKEACEIILLSVFFVLYEHVMINIIADNLCYEFYLNCCVD